MVQETTRAGRWSIGGALMAALAASACCLCPLLLAAIGLGGAGVTVGLGAYRPYLLAGTAVLLGLGFFFTYRKPTPDACGCERPRANTVGRLALWIATVVVVLVAGSPSLLAMRARSPHGSVADASLPKATILVAGIDCEACASPMRKALARVGGFHDLEMNVEKQAITVTYEPGPGRLEDYVRAIEALGYEASLPPPPADRGARP